MTKLHEIAACVTPLVEPAVLQEVNKRIINKAPLNATELRSACELLHYREQYWLLPSEYVEFLSGRRATLPPTAYLFDKAHTVARTLKGWGLLDHNTTGEGTLSDVPENCKTFKALSILSLKYGDERTKLIRHYDYTNLMTLLNYKNDAGDLC